MLRNHPASCNDESLGLAELFAEKPAEIEEDFGLADLFKEPEVKAQEKPSSDPAAIVIHTIPLNSLMMFMQLGLDIKNSVDLMVLLGLVESVTIPLTEKPNDENKKAEAKAPEKKNEQQREVDGISSPLLAKRGLFRCPNGMDHLHRTSDNSIYTEDFNDDDSGLSSDSSSEDDSSDDELFSMFRRFA